MNVAFSRDGGVTFGAPIRAGAEHDAGRVDLVLLGDGTSAMVTWVERAGVFSKVDGPPRQCVRQRSARQKSSARACPSDFPRIAHFKRTHSRRMERRRRNSTRYDRHSHTMNINDEIEPDHAHDVLPRRRFGVREKRDARYWNRAVRSEIEDDRREVADGCKQPQAPNRNRREPKSAIRCRRTRLPISTASR